MGYEFGRSSKKALAGVHPDLVSVCHFALDIATVDFGVHEGVRTAERQALYLEKGVTQVAFSKHQAQVDGYGHAVDLVPYVGGQLRWEWPLIWPVARAVQMACYQLGVPSRWGGAWHLPDFSRLPSQTPQSMNEAYNRNAGKKAFNDGAHFELSRVYRPADGSFVTKIPADDNQCHPQGSFLSRLLSKS